MNIPRTVISLALLCSAYPLSAGLLDRDHPIVNAYYAQWEVYSGFTIKNVDTSGTARHLDVLTYAFVNVGTNAQGQYECISFDCGRTTEPATPPPPIRVSMARVSR